MVEYVFQLWKIRPQVTRSAPYTADGGAREAPASPPLNIKSELQLKLIFIVIFKYCSHIYRCASGFVPWGGGSPDLKRNTCHPGGSSVSCCMTPDATTQQGGCFIGCFLSKTSRTMKIMDDNYIIAEGDKASAIATVDGWWRWWRATATGNSDGRGRWTMGEGRSC